MLALLGSLIAVGAALTFAAVGLLTIWGGREVFTRELPRDFTRSALKPGRRVLVSLVVGLPLALTALFGLLAAGRILLVALGLG